MPPNAGEYSEAFQNPGVVFRDPELKAATADKRFGNTPNLITGAFAAVCKMTATSGKAWAVRCFLRKFDDQQERYAAIAAALKALGSPSTVGFEYLPDGILVNGRRFPILKMEWVAGDSLLTYVQARLGKKALRKLADKIELLAKQLASAGIAHGDLQFGNIILQGDAPRLIDYDGMYVPALHGLGSHESGHANFQHPKRTGTDFGPTIDHFSVWSIAVALHALSSDRGLWDRHQGGDECLLFRKADFENPVDSKLFAELAKAGDTQVRELAGRFKSHLATNPLDIPAFLAKLVLPPLPPPPRPPDFKSFGDVLREKSSTNPSPSPQHDGNEPPANSPILIADGSTSDFASVRHLLAEWEIAIGVWEDKLNELRAGVGTVRPLRFGNSKHVEAGMWALALGATSAVGLCFGLGLPIWAAGPCLATICILRLSLAYKCYRDDAVHRIVRGRCDALSDKISLAEASRIFAVVAHEQFRKAAGPMVEERRRHEARVEIADEARRDLKHEPAEARRQLADARSRDHVATENHRRFTALGLASRPALALSTARNTKASLAVEGAKRQFEALAFEQRWLESLFAIEQSRIDGLRAKSNALAGVAKRHLKEFEKAEQHALYPPTRPDRELEAGLIRLERERTAATSEHLSVAQKLRARRDMLDKQFENDSGKITALALEHSVESRRLKALARQRDKEISFAANEKIAINNIHRDAIEKIDSEVKKLNRQCAERAGVGVRELTVVVTTTRVLHEAAETAAAEALAVLTCAERDPLHAQYLGRAKSAEVTANAAQSEFDIAGKALQIAVAELAAAKSRAVQHDRDTEAASVEVTASAAALLIAEQDAITATAVVAGFDLATQQLTDFRRIGIARIDAAARICQERSDAAVSQHSELTFAAKRSAASLTFRDYLRFGLTL